MATAVSLHYITDDNAGGSYRKKASKSSFFYDFLVFVRYIPVISPKCLITISVDERTVKPSIVLSPSPMK